MIRKESRIVASFNKARVGCEMVGLAVITERLRGAQLLHP